MGWLINTNYKKAQNHYGFVPFLPLGNVQHISCAIRLPLRDLRYFCFYWLLVFKANRSGIVLLHIDSFEITQVIDGYVLYGFGGACSNGQRCQP